MSNEAVRSKQTDKVKKNHRVLKIGEVSQLSGVGVEALRFYERNGLLEKPARTASGYRVYPEDVLDRLAFIKQAQLLGFSLDEIRRVIEDAQTGGSPCEDVRGIVRRRLEDLDERMREIRRHRDELAETLAEWERVGRAPGRICGLIEGAHIRHSVGRLSGLKKAKSSESPELETGTNRNSAAADSDRIVAERRKGR
ncbi:MAG: heavy metal-responsive transcriptional regulator [Blastocatellales bacterium]|nr:heavy metal-responsive transcriptional regulator [Blastocatellales bacterium]